MGDWWREGDLHYVKPKQGRKRVAVAVAASISIASIGVRPSLAVTGTLSTWNGGGTDNNWTTAQNWTGSVAPSNDGTANITMAGSTRLTSAVNAPWAINSLNFSSGSGGFTLSGGPLTIGAGGITNLTGSFTGVVQTVAAPIVLSSNQKWNAGTTPNGYLFVKALNNSGYNLQVTGTNTVGFQSTITGSGSLTVNSTGAAEVIEYTANTYTGGTIVNSGELYVSSDASMGPATAPLTLSGGGFITGFGGGVGSPGGVNQILNRPITLGPGGGVIGNLLPQGLSLTIPSVISGAGSLTFNGPGEDANDVLAGQNTYTGGTIVQNVTMVGTTSTIQGNVQLNASSQIEFNQTTSGTYAGVISGMGSLVKYGTGTATLTGNNTYTNTTEIYGGMLEIQAGTTALPDASPLYFESGFGIVQYVGNATVTRTIGTNVIFNSAGGFSARNGRLTLNFGGNDAPITPPTVGNSQLLFGSPTANGVTELQNPITLDAAQPTPDFKVNSGTGGDYALFSGPLSGGNGFTKSGTGELVLSAISSYTGDTNVIGGLLVVTGTLGATHVAVSGGASLGGIGSIGGTVTIAGGSNASAVGLINLVDGTAGQLTLSDPTETDTVLTIGGAAGQPSALDFEVGGSSDKIVLLAGRLVVNPGGGSIDIMPIAGLQAGVFDLIDFSPGQAAGLNNLSLADPVLPGGYFLSLQQTATAEQLVVAVPEPGNLAPLLIGAPFLLPRFRRAR